MQTFYARLERATQIQRHEDGAPWAWKPGDLIAEFRNPQQFVDFVKEHVTDLRHAAVTCTGAMLITRCNAYLGQELKKAGLL
jgi:hypothetical protein